MVIYGCERGAVEIWALEQQMALVLFGEQSKHIPSNSCAAERCLRRQGFPAMWEMQLHCFWPKLLLKDFRGSHVKSDCAGAVLPSPPLCSSLGCHFPLEMSLCLPRLYPRMLIQPQQSQTSALVLVVFP